MSSSRHSRPPSGLGIDFGNTSIASLPSSDVSDHSAPDTHTHTHPQSQHRAGAGMTGYDPSRASAGAGAGAAAGDSPSQDPHYSPEKFQMRKLLLPQRAAHSRNASLHQPHPQAHSQGGPGGGAGPLLGLAGAASGAVGGAGTAHLQGLYPFSNASGASIMPYNPSHPQMYTASAAATATAGGPGPGRAPSHGQHGLRHQRSAPNLYVAGAGIVSTVGLSPSLIQQQQQQQQQHDGANIYAQPGAVGLGLLGPSPSVGAGLVGAGGYGYPQQGAALAYNPHHPRSHPYHHSQHQPQPQHQQQNPARRSVRIASGAPNVMGHGAGHVDCTPSSFTPSTADGTEAEEYDEEENRPLGLSRAAKSNTNGPAGLGLGLGLGITNFGMYDTFSSSSSSSSSAPSPQSSAVSSSHSHAGAKRTSTSTSGYASSSSVKSAASAASAASSGSSGMSGMLSSALARTANVLRRPASQPNLQPRTKSSAGPAPPLPTAHAAPATLAEGTATGTQAPPQQPKPQPQTNAVVAAVAVGKGLPAKPVAAIQAIRKASGQAMPPPASVPSRTVSSSGSGPSAPATLRKPAPTSAGDASDSDAFSSAASSAGKGARLSRSSNLAQQAPRRKSTQNLRGASAASALHQAAAVRGHDEEVVPEGMVSDGFGSFVPIDRAAQQVSTPSLLPSAQQAPPPQQQQQEKRSRVQSQSQPQPQAQVPREYQQYVGASSGSEADASSPSDLGMSTDRETTVSSASSSQQQQQQRFTIGGTYPTLQANKSTELTPTRALRMAHSVSDLSNGAHPQQQRSSLQPANRSSYRIPMPRAELMSSPHVGAASGHSSDTTTEAAAQALRKRVRASSLGTSLPSRADAGASLHGYTSAPEGTEAVSSQQQPVQGHRLARPRSFGTGLDSLVQMRSQRGMRGLEAAETGGVMISLDQLGKGFQEGQSIVPQQMGRAMEEIDPVSRQQQQQQQRRDRSNSTAASTDLGPLDSVSNVGSSTSAPHGASKAAPSMLRTTTTSTDGDRPRLRMVRSMTDVTTLSSASSLLDRQATLLSATSNPNRRSRELGRLLGTSSAREKKSDISADDAADAQIISSAASVFSSASLAAQQGVLEHGRSGKARVELDLNLESDLVVEGGSLRGVVMVKIPKGSDKEGPVRLMHPKVRVVGFEGELQQIRSCFLQPADLPSICRAHRGRHAVHLLPPGDRRQRRRDGRLRLARLSRPSWLGRFDRTGHALLLRCRW